MKINANEGRMCVCVIKVKLFIVTVNNLWASVWLQSYIHHLHLSVGLWNCFIIFILLIIIKAFLTLRHKNLCGVDVTAVLWPHSLIQSVMTRDYLHVWGVSYKHMLWGSVLDVTSLHVFINYFYKKLYTRAAKIKLSTFKNKSARSMIWAGR